MKLLNVIYTGLNGEKGYRTDKEYVIVFKETGIFKKTIHIWRAKHEGASTGHLQYESMDQFLSRWEILNII